MNKKDREILTNVIEKPHLLGQLVGKDRLTELHSCWIKYIWYPAAYFFENDNWKKLFNYFNSLGNTIDVFSNNGEIVERKKLTEEIFIELLKSEKRSLQAHRGSYKSTAIDIIGAILRMLFEPDIRIGIIRKDFTKAAYILKNISAMMKNEKIIELFTIAHKFPPKSTKDADDRLIFNFKSTITPEGNINAYGIHSNITGDHLDFIVFDDFVTIEDRISKAEREKTKIRLEEIVNFVLDPGKQAGFIGTTWHKDDAWSICPTPLKFDIYTLPILSEEEIEKKRKTTTYITFALNYELRIAKNVDTLFKEPNIKRWEFAYKNGIGHLDKKFFGYDTNALTFCAKKSDGRYQVIGFSWKEHIKEKISIIKELKEKYHIGTIYTEDNDDKGTISDILIKEGFLIKTYHENTNKHIKIKSNLIENGFWDLIDFDPDTDPEYFSQILDYVERSEPDDAPDSLSCIGRIMMTKTNYVFVNRWKNL